MKHLIRLFFTFFCLHSLAQTVQVVEYESGLPIENVVIYNENKKIVNHTDKFGKAKLNEYTDNEIISFNHLGFVELELLKRDLIDINYTVKLYKKSQLLDEIVLSVSRDAEKKNRVAEQVSIITSSDIKQKTPQTSADLLATIPGIRVQKTQLGGGSPVIRGMEANRVLLVVDGVRMNNAIYRTGHLQNSITVSPTIIDRTEVIYGPSSVIYGSDALGGVINYFTKKPEINGKKGVNINYLSRYSSANQEKTTHADIELSYAKWASLTAVSYSDFNDLKMGTKRNHNFNDWGKINLYSDNSDTFYHAVGFTNPTPAIQKNSGYNQLDVLQKFYIPLSLNADLTFNIQYSTSSDIPNFDNLAEVVNGKLRYAESYYGPQDRLLIAGNFHFNPEYSFLENGTITLAYQQIEESRIERRMNSLDRYYRYENVDVFSLNGDFSVPLNAAKNRNLTYGVELTHNEVASNAFGKTISVNGNSVVGFSRDFVIQSRYPDGGSTYTSGALYANYRQDLNQKSTLNTGIRYTATFLNARWDDATFITLPDMDVYSNNDALTATIGYIFKPNKNWQVNTVLASGFRSPNIDDIGKIRYKSGQVTVPNIYLKPEYVYSAEVGVIKYFNEKKFFIGYNAYYSLLNNYIARGLFNMNGHNTLIYDGVTAITAANINNKNAYIFGSTLSYQGLIAKNIKSRGSITYTKGESYDKKQPLSSIPPLFGDVELTYQLKKLEATFAYKFNAAKKLEQYNLEEGIDNIEQTPFSQSTNSYYGTPKWSIFNVSSSYKFTDKIKVTLKVDNVFDIHYKEFASSISAAGRNFIASLEISI
ncbi:MAG: TonB-dependent receptor [Bacteroidetes bacterium]|nr:TonB-dependent receptor [Bacteroidota bacterium]